MAAISHPPRAPRKFSLFLPVTLLQLWVISRGDDLRGNEHYDVTVGKVFGTYAPACIVSPDRFYELQVLKDESKANKSPRPELIGANIPASCRTEQSTCFDVGLWMEPIDKGMNEVCFRDHKSWVVGNKIMEM